MENLKKITQGIVPDRWKLFFKMFCFVNPHNVPIDSIEAAFMYEQVSSKCIIRNQSTCIILGNVYMQVHIRGRYRRGVLRVLPVSWLSRQSVTQ